MQIKKNTFCAVIVISAAITITPLTTRAQSYGLPTAGQHKTYLQRLNARLNRMGANLATLMTNNEKVQGGLSSPSHKIFINNASAN